MTEERRPPYRFAFSATFTAEPVERVVRFWGEELNWDLECRFAAFNQVPQTLLDRAGLFARNTEGINVVLLRAEDVGGAENAIEIASMCREAGASLSQPVLLVLCPPSTTNQPDAEDIARRIELLLSEAHGVQFLTWMEIGKLYPCQSWSAPSSESVGGVPYSEAGFAALGTAIVRCAHAMRIPPVKVIAVDCDNTLWKGICGEDGPAGVVLDPGRAELHHFLLEQREAGLLLSIASKNNESDVWETFAAHPEFPLQQRHFTTWRINWESKAANLLEMAAELNVGIDSIVLLDDNPKECAEVESAARGALAIPAPEDSSDFEGFLKHLWVLDHPVITEEDRRRAASIAQSLEFNREARKAESLEEFIANLDLRVDLRTLVPERLGRVAQLTQRTNQFNNSGLRRTEGEIQSLLSDGNWICYTAEVSDRFGEYGLVGAMLVEKRLQEYSVETFVLSCRALGRGVEHRMLAALAEAALDEGVYTVVVPWRVTARNRPMREFLDTLPAASGSVAGEEGLLRLEATELQALRWRPKRSAPPAREQGSAPSAQRRFDNYAAIASSLRSPEAIVAAMRRQAATHAADGAAGGLSGDLEVRLARIWSELLEKPVESPDANFFDLGGHSLLAVMLLMRVREEFGVELPVDEVYSGSLTLGELVRRIEAQQMGLAGAGEYEALLAEIEGLSDDEVRALLEEAGAGGDQ